MEDATDWTAHSYDREVVDRVWAMARTVEGNDDALWRKDECGAWMRSEEHTSELQSPC